MIYYRCKCGEHESWSSMGPRRCTRCKKCGSNLASGPESHSEPEPHDVIRVPVETDTGEAFLSTCSWCFKTKAELIALGEPINETRV